MVVAARHSNTSVLVDSVAVDRHPFAGLVALKHLMAMVQQLVAVVLPPMAAMFVKSVLDSVFDNWLEYEHLSLIKEKLRQSMCSQRNELQCDSEITRYWWRWLRNRLLLIR